MGVILYLVILWGWIPLCIFFLSRVGWTNIIRSLMLSAFMLILNTMAILAIESSPLTLVGVIVGFALMIALLIAYFNFRRSSRPAG